VSEAPSEQLESCASDQVQPVPLTDVILQQCGFIFHQYFKFWQFPNSFLCEHKLLRNCHDLIFLTLLHESQESAFGFGVQ
jgi:hypothetical protein